MNNTKLSSLVLVALLLAFTSLPALATIEQQRNMLDQLDQLDHQEFLALTEKAYSCIQSRDFGCAENKLTKAGKYLTNPHDRKTLNIARKDLAAERVYEKKERAAVAEQARQAQLARQRAAEAEAERQRREERAQQEASNDNLMKGLFAIGTGAYIGSVTKNTNLGVAAAKSVYTGDTEGFNTAVDQAKAEREQAYNAKMAAIRAEKAERDAERQRNAKIERDKRANAERNADARRIQEDTRMRQQEQERKKAEAEKTKLADQQAEKQAQLNAKQQAKQQAQLKAKQQSQQQAQLPAKKQTQQQAQQQALLDAKQQAQQQAQLKAKQLAQQQAQLPAKKQTQQQAQQQALLEAKQQAQQQAAYRAKSGADSSPATAGASDPASKTSHTSGSLTRVLGIVVMAPPQNASGTDALSVEWVSGTYNCLNYPYVTELIPGGTCDVLPLKRIQCRSDWLKSQELLDYLGCLSRVSTGEFKLYYGKIAGLLK